MEQTPSPVAADALRVERWPSERPLLALMALSAAVIWSFLFLSVVGLAYAVMIALFLFVTHVAFVAHLRGSAVRLGPEQFPDLYRRVQELAARAGIRETPEAYVMQAGGVLNAMATKFLRSKMIVLFSDLLEACGENAGARDMIIGHELGHIKAGHLRWMWLLFPAHLVPFLGAAYSRAREYTCDRYGAALCGDPRAALVGLAILAAGGAHGPRVNLQAMARQREQMNTGWMTLGKWLGSHPPLCDRIGALQPSVADGVPAAIRGPVRAVALVGVPLLLAALGGSLFVTKLLPKFRELTARAGTTPGPLAERRPDAVWAGAGSDVSAVDDLDGVMDQVDADLEALATLVREHQRRTGRLPADERALYGLWRSSRRGEPVPVDPFDGGRYGYAAQGSRFVVWSSGPDGKSDTDDDIILESRARP